MASVQISSTFRMLLALIVPAAVAGVLALSTSRVVGTHPAVPDRTKPGAVLWGDRLFNTRKQLASWLGARGVTYEQWAKRHPRAAARQRKYERARGDYPNG